MTVTTTNVRNVLTGNGVATAFAFTFRFLSASTVQVFRNMPGAAQTLVPTSAYTLTPGVGNVGGTVTFTTAPANTEIITIQRTVPLTQSVDINNEDGFFPDVVENGLDAVTLAIQQVRDQSAASGGLQVVGGMDATLRQVRDVNGVTAPMRLSSTEVAIDATRATGGTALRSLGDHLRDFAVNVRDFGALGDGATNDAPAFQAAVDSAPTGRPVRIIVPATVSSYLLNSDITANGRLPIFVLADGAILSGTGRIRCAVDYLNSFPRRYYGTVQQQEWQPAKWPTVDGSLYNGPIGVNLLRNGGFGTYGAALFNLTVSDAIGATEIDVGLTSWVSHQNLTGGQVYGAWIGANTPSQPFGQTWTTGGVGAAEFNTGNRWADWGLLETPLSGPRYTYGIQVVPDEIPAADGAPGPVYPGSFGVVTAPSIHGHKWWTGYFSWADAIMPGGYVMHLWGGSTAPNAAAAGIKFSGQYTLGLDFRSGVYASNRAIMMANDQQVAMADANVTLFANASNFAVNMVGAREGLFFVNNFGAVAFRWGHSSGTPSIGFLGAAAVTRPTVTGSRAGNAALASVLTALSNLGLITDSST